MYFDAVQHFAADLDPWLARSHCWNLPALELLAPPATLHSAALQRRGESSAPSVLLAASVHRLHAVPARSHHTSVNQAVLALPPARQCRQALQHLRRVSQVQFRVRAPWPAAVAGIRLASLVSEIAS